MPEIDPALEHAPPVPDRVRSSKVSSRPARNVLPALTVVLLALSSNFSALGWGGKIKLARKYRPGQTMVYETKMRTRATVTSNPSGLKMFLPPLPTELTARQQNTITVRTVHPDGTADVEARFDRFEFQSDLFARLPENVRDSAQKAQEEFSHQMSGRTLTAHYDREGRLLGFEGSEDILQQLDVPLRESFRQVLRFFLEQVGGNALYTDHRVKAGEKWKRKLSALATDQSPFASEVESTLHYVGKTRYRGVKAAVVDYQFTDSLTPSLESLRGIGPLAQLESLGVKLDLRIDGQGQGRVLLALGDGRVLQNRSAIHQALTARLKSPPQNPTPNSQPLTIEINAETTLEVDGSNP